MRSADTAVTVRFHDTERRRRMANWPLKWDKDPQIVITGAGDAHVDAIRRVAPGLGLEPARAHARDSVAVVLHRLLQKVDDGGLRSSAAEVGVGRASGSTAKIRTDTGTRRHQEVVGWRG